MKTIKDWLETLPEPYRSKALQYYKDNHAEVEKTDSLEMAIVWGFPWDKTIEGPNFWEDVSNGHLPYCPTNAPTCAIEALHAIALKKGFPVEDIIAVGPFIYTEWWYKVKGNDNKIYINLKPE